MSPKSSKKPNRRTPPRKSPAAGQPAARSQKAAGRPSGSRETPFYTPTSKPLRKSIERASAPALMLMTQLPRPVVMFTPLVLVLLGFFLPLAIGLVFLGLFFLLTSWLAYLSWPRADLRARLIRVAMFALVIALAVLRVTRG